MSVQCQNWVLKRHAVDSKERSNRGVGIVSCVWRAAHETFLTPTHPVRAFCF